MNLQLINVGNTHAQIAICEKGILRIEKTLPTHELSISDINDILPVVGATVVPEVKDRFSSYKNITWIDSRMDLGVDLSKVESSTLGADRLANVVALSNCSSLPALCIDAGTAITVDVLSEHRVFLGGIIAPGRMMARRALIDGTAQLPMVPIENNTGNVLGMDTESAILSGVDIGSLGMLKHLIAEIEESLSCVCQEKVIIGGDAEFFLSNLSGLKYGGRDFTLRGLLYSWERLI